MKARYAIALLFLALIFIAFSYADTDAIKSEFFGAKSLLSSNNITLFNNASQKGELAFDVTRKSGENRINYRVYRTIDGFALESKENFDFSVLLDNAYIDEFSIPYGVINCFSEQMHTDFANFVDSFIQALKSCADESDFKISTIYKNENGLRNKYDSITLRISDKKRLQSLFIPYGIADVKSFGFTRDVANGNVMTQKVSVISSSGNYNFTFNDRSEGIVTAFEVTFSDTSSQNDFTLSFHKDRKSEVLIYGNGSVSAEITKKNGNISIIIEDGTQTVIKPFIASGYKPTGKVYDMRVAKQRGEIFVKLGTWLKNEKKAALLFNTYEVNTELKK